MHKAMESLILIAECAETKEDLVEFLENITERNDIDSMDDLAAVLDEFIM